MQIDQEALTTIAREAGEKILTVYNNPDLASEVNFKSDESPLTLADQAAHEFIEKELTRLYPDIPILSEEGKKIPYEIRNEWKRFWMVDPLDGTKEFVKRNGEFTVNIALIEGSRSVFGVVYIPVTREVFCGEKGRGAFLIRENGRPIKMTASKVDMKAKGLRIVASRSHMNDAVKEYLTQFDEPKVVSMGSSLKFMLVAEGKADIYPRLAPTMEWDTAAAQIIVEEAGGSVLQYPSMEPVVYNKEDLLNPHFLVFGNLFGN